MFIPTTSFEFLLPTSPDLKLTRLEVLANQIQLFLESSHLLAHCPNCQHPSRQIHGYYNRTLQDLSWGTFAVRLYLRVRRFVCLNSACPKTTFSQDFGSEYRAYARRTSRLNSTLQELAFEAGGEGGKRLAQQFQLTVSGNTLLRLIRAAPLPQFSTPRVLAVDDFAFAKGEKYGTILLDLGQHQVIDLLADREMKTLVAWLEAHPGIEIVSRDRSSAYSEAIRTAAPQAIQVADRFHLAQNLRKTTERFMRRNYPKIVALLKPAEVAQLPPAPVPISKYPTSAQIRRMRSPKIESEPTLARREREKASNQAKRIALYHQVQELGKQGLKRYQIAQRLGMDAKRVSEYLVNPPLPPVYSSFRSKLDPYKAYLKSRFFKDGCQNALQLLQEIRTQGYQGGATILTRYIRQLRAELKLLGAAAGQKGTKAKLPSPQQLSWWFCLPVEKLKSWEQNQLNELCQLEPELARAYQLTQQFRRLLKSREGEGLYQWLKAVEDEPISEYESLAWGIAKDRAAVENGINLPWNQGQIEGAVNRLKLIKRQMYNRGNFDLLKARVLKAA